ncbi:hypothetical protein [Polaromonas sp.]|uniref:hypothetical protein n=1 Tax=Polaromonas sp. TaxID=1869339 RepID=UPI003BB4C4CE
MGDLATANAIKAAPQRQVLGGVALSWKTKVFDIVPQQMRLSSLTPCNGQQSRPSKENSTE